MKSRMNHAEQEVKRRENIREVQWLIWLRRIKEAGERYRACTKGGTISCREWLPWRSRRGRAMITY